MKIALDVMGTDYGPKELVLGAVQAVKEFNCEIVLVGDPETIENLLREYKADTDSRLSICPATEVVRMDEHPSIAVKQRRILLLLWQPAFCARKMRCAGIVRQYRCCRCGCAVLPGAH